MPVLLKQSVEGLVTDPNGVYVDATFGGGGHSRLIVSLLSPKGHLYGFDQDADAMQNIISDERFTFVYSNFRYMRNFMRWYGHSKVNGILADLGVSWHHFDDSSRGFSFRFEGPIDMRMNQKEGIKASDVLNDYPVERLAQLFWLYGVLAMPSCNTSMPKAFLASSCCSTPSDSRNSLQMQTSSSLAKALPTARH